ncbi:MAG: hypothetical protein J7L14_00070 [Candidatus Diapherotrites archaeon]|nr:hypothetical protein [Candidatus Diapherotrites archaeon]
MEHPEAKPIAEAKELVKILEFINRAASSFETIKRNVQMEEDALLLSLEALIKAKLIEKESRATKIFYYTTNLGRKFIELYREAKKEMHA